MMAWLQKAPKETRTANEAGDDDTWRHMTTHDDTLILQVKSSHQAVTLALLIYQYSFIYVQVFIYLWSLYRFMN